MVYLDHAATTPLLPEALEAMLPLLKDDFGNASSVHAAGRTARAAVETARERVAAATGASPAEIVFTGGGTEADNLAIKGAARRRRGSGKHLVTTVFEHHAVLDPIEWLVTQGYEVTRVSVPASGVVDPAEVAAAVRRDTTLVSVMAVNNEVGTIQPLREVVRAVKDVDPEVLVHTDAVQALGNIPVDVHLWGVDLASFSAHKLGGPKGTGALFVRAGVPLEPLFHGGGQERGTRSGTLDTAGIAGFGAAAEVAAKEVDEKSARVRALRTRLFEGIKAATPNVRVNGDPDQRVAGNLNISVPGTEGETLLLLLDRAGIACSTGSACSSGALDPSHVLLALGIPREVAVGSVRFSLGRTTTDADVERVLEVWPEVVQRARRAA